jgi:D-alanyl-D-alanine carboxypeptidase (penicillin-binding protein 5/6)
MKLSAKLASLVISAVLAVLMLPTSTANEIGGPQLNQVGIIVNLSEEIPPLPKAKVKSYLIANMTTGEVLAAKNPHKQLPPASTIKALTAITLLDKLEPSREYTARRVDAQMYGSQVGIVQGRKYTIEQLFYGLLLPSANDVAMALANANGGIENTLKQMNQTAKSLKAFNTVAKSPHGLDTAGQVSTAYDLALIGRAAINNDNYRKYARTMRYVFPKTGRTAVAREIANTNRLLASYPGLIAGKTGFTTKARNTYIGAARRQGQVILITFMGAQTGRDALATQLFDWGFAVDGFIAPVGKLAD